MSKEQKSIEINPESNSRENYAKRQVKADIESQRSDLNLENKDDDGSIWKNLRGKFK